ncbi:hypothetical protein SAMN03080615_01595 [Amphritea atlantica]|uniref:Uncharacterized protein n=1 Tax=Amphritea atlantica TaxID=355243 RepID=A0A1H9GC17_9GAMM|nr:hypothetical protein [Amphritea atlantica]SEQ47583.1 hypothetical protein SAMN03080615_01595 [Amphritea atlantica]
MKTELNTELNRIIQLEEGLVALASLYHNPMTGDRILKLELNYHTQIIGAKSFTLQGFSGEEAENLVRNLPDNQYIMREIDEFLAGDMD